MSKCKCKASEKGPFFFLFLSDGFYDYWESELLCILNCAYFTDINSFLFKVAVLYRLDTDTFACLGAINSSDLLFIIFPYFPCFQCSATSFLPTAFTVNTDTITVLFLYQIIKLTLFDRLPIWEGERSDEEFGFSYLYPVVQNFYCPDTRSQGQIQRWFVVSIFSTGFNKNIIRCCYYIDWIHPNDSNGDVGAFPPFLHANWLICWPKESSKVAEKPLLGVPLSADLKSETTLLLTSSLQASETLVSHEGSPDTQIIFLKWHSQGIQMWGKLEIEAFCFFCPFADFWLIQMFFHGKSGVTSYSSSPHMEAVHEEPSLVTGHRLCIAMHMTLICWVSNTYNTR